MKQEENKSSFFPNSCSNRYIMKCKLCYSKTNLVKHHIAYKKYGAVKDKIIILCKDCHNFLHRFVKGNDQDLLFVTNNFLKAKKWW